MLAESLTRDSVIDDLGGTKAVAEDLGLAESTVSGWRVRGIPSGRWTGVARLAKTKGRSDITLERLAALEDEEVGQ